jgi:hypothetical protein
MARSQYSRWVGVRNAGMMCITHTGLRDQHALAAVRCSRRGNEAVLQV